jgi:hypothetical protein
MSDHPLNSELMTIRANSRPAHRTPLARLGALSAATLAIFGLIVMSASVAGADVTGTTGASTTTTPSPSTDPSATSTTSAPTTTAPSSTTPTTSAPAPAPATAPSTAPSPTSNAALTVPSYWTVASDGGVFAFGGSPFFGSMGGKALNAPIVGMASTNDHGGYWLVASDGGIFSFGDANFWGSEGGKPLNQPIVGMTPTADGKGYWLVASDGGIFAFGDAVYFGSRGGQPLNRPIVGMTATTDGQGYWLVASDGGIFAYGDATFAGSTGNMKLNAPVVGMTATPGGGYLLVASDGGIFGFGITASQFYGSEGGNHLNAPIVGIVSTPGETGYWLVARDGGIFAFGKAGFYGSMGGQHLNAPMVSAAQTFGDGTFTKPTPSLSFSSGSYGYDVSIFNCGNLPPAGAINIVQVVGAAFGSTNRCLGQEVQWAGAGLNLYMFLTYGSTQGPMPAFCNNTPNYCYGYEAGQDAVNKGNAAGIPTNVNWWIDVESTAGSGLPAWSGDTHANDLVIQGAHDGIAASGAANVGVYASPGGGWPQIAGNWPIDYPYWMASWTSSGPNSCATIAGWQRTSKGLPSGGVPIVQWSNNAFQVNNQATDGDYVC